MPQPLTFSAWLASAPQPWFTALCETRRDLMRTDAPSLRAVAAAAASRAGVALVLEALDTRLLQIAHRAAVAARTEPVVPAGVLGATTADLTRLVTLGLLWPAFAEDAQDPTGASAYRIHSEAVGLLPTSAADRRSGIPWLEFPPERPADPAPLTVPDALVGNAEAAAASALVGEVLAVPDTFAAEPVSQLVSGGIGKRDVQQLARTLGTDTAHTVFLLELAGAAGLLGVGGPDVDPQWGPTSEFDRMRSAGRAETYVELLRTWLLREVDTVHVLAGRTDRGDRLHALATLVSPTRHNAYAGFPSSKPQLAFLTSEVLAALAGLADDLPGRAVHDAVLVDAVRWDHPLLAAAAPASIEQIVREAEAFGLVCTPLASPDAHALTHIGLRVVGGLREAMAGSLSLVPWDAERVTLPEDLTSFVDSLLPALQTTVLVQSDLTAVATGPLDPQIHSELTRIAVVDTRGQGTVYRFTTDSIAEALRTGMSAEEVLALVSRISSTGVPQPLTFLVDEAAARLRRVQVAPARAVVVVDDPADLEALLANPALVPAGLVRVSATVAVANVPQDRLAHLLEASGQPTLRHAANGPVPRAPVPQRPAPVSRRSTRVADRSLPAFIRALRSSGTEEPAEAPASVLDVLREAAEDRHPVDVVLVATDGTRHRAHLLPTHVSAGRVRARRLAPGRTGTETEVTVGISRIVSAVRSPEVS